MESKNTNTPGCLPGVEDRIASSSESLQGTRVAQNPTSCVPRAEYPAFADYKRSSAIGTHFQHDWTDLWNFNQPHSSGLDSC